MRLFVFMFPLLSVVSCNDKDTARQDDVPTGEFPGEFDPSVGREKKETTVSPFVLQGAHAGEQEAPMPDHPYMQVMGWGCGEYRTLFGKEYHTRFVYHGKAADWKKLLSTIDTYRSFNNYLLPFFAATGVVSEGNVNRFFGVNADYMENYMFKEAQPNENDILELLRALYDTDINTRSTLVLPRKFTVWNSNIPSFYDAGFDGLAAFIFKYQTLLIYDISTDDTGSARLESWDIKKLAEQGTRWSDVGRSHPVVVEAMISNAFATSVAAVKMFIGLGSDADETKRNIAQSEAMVMNSALVIKGALDAYDNPVTMSNEVISSAFGNAWELIPFPGGKLANGLASKAKEDLDLTVKEELTMGRAYEDVTGFKEALKANYLNILSVLSAAGYIDFVANGSLDNTFVSTLGD